MVIFLKKIFFGIKTLTLEYVKTQAQLFRATCTDVTFGLVLVFTVKTVFTGQIDEIRSNLYLINSVTAKSVHGIQLKNSTLLKATSSIVYMPNAYFPLCLPPFPLCGFIWLLLWRFLGGHRVNWTSQGRRGGGIRLSL